MAYPLGSWAGGPTGQRAHGLAASEGGGFRVGHTGVSSAPPLDPTMIPLPLLKKKKLGYAPEFSFVIPIGKLPIINRSLQ